MKKLLSAALAVLLLFAAVSCEAGTGTPSDPTLPSAGESELFTYESKGDHTVITRYIGQATHVVVPAMLGGHPVREIGESAFADRAALLSVDIPDTVTTIAPRAFYRCYYLEEVTGFASVQTVGEWAFAYDERLKTIPLTENLKSVGNRAFFWCSSFDEVTIPASLDNIEEKAFCNAGMKTLTFADGELDYIGEQAFMECNNVEKLVYPHVKVKIGDGAFKHMYGLKELTFDERVTSIGAYMFQHCEAIEEVTIPAHITSIETYAFGSCMGMKKIVFEGTDILLGALLIHQNKTVDYYVHRGSNVELAARSLNWDNVTVIELIDGKTKVHYEDHLRFIED